MTDQHYAVVIDLDWYRRRRRTAMINIPSHREERAKALSLLLYKEPRKIDWLYRRLPWHRQAIRLAAMDATILGYVRWDYSTDLYQAIPASRDSDAA